MDDTQLSQLNGTVCYNQYHEKIPLPTDSVVHVTLQDVSLMDVASKQISQQTIESPTTHPIPYCLRYDSSQIEDFRTYSVSASIRSSVEKDSKLLWISTTMHPVLTRGAPKNNVNIEVDHVGR